LVVLDDRALRMDPQAAEPFGADVIVAFVERERLRGIGVEIGEMEEEAHVERLADRPELHHQRVIEADEMVVPQRAHDRLGQDDGARLDRIALELAPLDPYLREDVERVLDEAPTALLEMRR